MKTFGLALSGFENPTARQLGTLLDEMGPEAQRWHRADEDAADVVLVDADTLGGHMTWLKLTAAGRSTIACSTTPASAEAAARALHLLLPAQAETLARALAAARGQLAEDGAEDVAAVDDPAIEATSPREVPRLCDWLLSDASTPLVIEGSGRRLVIDPKLDRWFGDTALKPLATLLLERCSAATIPDGDTLAAADGAQAQGLPRLRWYAALIAHPGALPQGAQEDSRLHLTRWPEIEREFPRHFRIASALMRRPSTLAEIAGQTGVDVADVADFARAAQARGMLEVLPPSNAAQVDQAPLAARR